MNGSFEEEVKAFLKEISNYAEEIKEIPEDKCPIEYISDLGYRIENYCLIVLDKKCVEQFLLAEKEREVFQSGILLTITSPYKGEVISLIEINQTKNYIVSSIQTNKIQYTWGNFKGPFELYLKKT